MGQKQSSSNRFLTPLPEIYQKNDISEVYSLIGYDINTIIQQNKISSQITNPQTVTDNKNLTYQIQPTQPSQSSRTNHKSLQQPQQYHPPFLKHFTILLNKFQTRQYLNHLVFRNQPEFRQFIVQLPFGQVQKQDKYTKVHLYVDQLVFTLNQVFNLPFYDMAMVLYTAVIAYKYLYSYFGLFKIEANMIGFTRQAKAKVWLNHKLTKDKPQPIVSDINLKRHKEQQSYMVDDLLTIFSNKVDKTTIPHNFTLINNTSNIRASRATRLSFSRVSQEQDLSQSTVSSLENNLISDFSDCSFDKCLQYLEEYFNIQRPEFSNVNKEKGQKVLNSQVNRREHKNFISSIFELIKTRKQFTQQGSDLRNSRANVNINLRQITGINPNKVPSITGLQFRRTSNQQHLTSSVVHRPNIMFNSVPVTNSSITQSSKISTNQQQVKFTTSSYIPPQMTSTVIPSQQLNYSKSKSKPKVTFNSSSTLYQRISPNNVYNSSIVQKHQVKSNSSLEKIPISISPHNSIHESMVSPQTINENDFSFRITTSQVQPVYSSTENQDDLKPGFSSQHINFKSGISSNCQHEEINDKYSIIDEVTKV